jgi:hypothetical protein
MCRLHQGGLGPFGGRGAAPATRRRAYHRTMAGSPLDSSTLDLLDDAIEVDARTPRRDGSISSRPIWVVVAEGDAYVRSYRGAGGAWYRHAKDDGRLTLVAGQTEIEAAVEPATDDDVNRRVSDAYREKYGERSPGSTETMVDPEISATTLRLAAP